MTQPEKVKTPGPAPPGPSASTNTISGLETTNQDQSNGYEDAALHLLAHGLMPAANPQGLRLMWRRGGHSRQSALLIAQAWQLVA